MKEKGRREKTDEEERVEKERRRERSKKRERLIAGKLEKKN